MVEEWRPTRYPGYSVSNLGRVRGVRGGIMRGTLNNRTGYVQISITSNRSGQGKQLKPTVHTLVAEAFLGPRPEGMEVCHNDGDRSNNWADNLRWGTHASNGKDMIAHGRNVGGRRSQPRG